MSVFTMPSLGADMEAGTLVEWLVAPGDAVARGDVIAVVETQKGAIEIETFQAGTVHRLDAEIGKKLPVGAPMAVILSEGEAPPAAPAPEAAAPPVPADEPVPDVVSPEPPAAAPATAAPSKPGAASPAARVRAAELGLDLAGISGSGPGGAVLLSDIETRTTPTATPETSISPLDAMRQAIAAAMSRSKREIPHFYVSQTIDVQAATDWLAAQNAALAPGDRLLMGALFVRAAALAAAKVMQVNGHYVDGAFRPSDRVHPGVAVALRGGGLVAPAIADGPELTLGETMAQMRDLVTRARAGRLRSSEMTQGTITISSLGDGSAEAMTGVIFPPQVALLALGAPQLRPWVSDGEIEPRMIVKVTLSADHRVSDGRLAARFLSEFDTLLQNPEAL